MCGTAHFGRATTIPTYGVLRRGHFRYARIREGNYRKGALVAASRRPKVSQVAGPLTIIDAPMSALQGE